MRTFLALAVPAIAGAVLMATPSAAAPLSLARPDISALATQVQWGGGYERREEYRERRRDYDGDRWRRREWREDGDDWRRRERRRMFCRYHPEACDRY
jgi:hypothetical protein